MSKERAEPPYPVRSLHDFLTELNREWDKFRMGSLLGMITSGGVLFFVVSRLLFAAIRHRNVLDLLFFLVVAALLVYCIYAMYAQHQFFKRWERRIGLLIHLEEKLMEEALTSEGETAPP